MDRDETPGAAQGPAICHLGAGAALGACALPPPPLPGLEARTASLPPSRAGWGGRSVPLQTLVPVASMIVFNSCFIKSTIPHSAIYVFVTSREKPRFEESPVAFHAFGAAAQPSPPVSLSPQIKPAPCPQTPAPRGPCSRLSQTLTEERGTQCGGAFVTGVHAARGRHAHAENSPHWAHTWASVLPGRGCSVRAGARLGWKLWGDPPGEGAGTWTLLMLGLVTPLWETRCPGQRHQNALCSDRNTGPAGGEAGPAGHTALLPVPAEPSWPGPPPPSDPVGPATTSGTTSPSPCEATGRWTSCDSRNPSALSTPTPGSGRPGTANAQPVWVCECQ